jgi:fluoroacetyl-CoA thioesterase
MYLYEAMSEPALNSSVSARLVVGDHDLASALRFEPGDEFPPVFATSRLVALMEVAAARLLRPHLGPGELSVGTLVDIVHTAATPLRGTVTATATFVGREGKLFVFEISASDDAGEVGRGTHKRAIVSSERLVASASKRGPAA